MLTIEPSVSSPRDSAEGDGDGGTVDATEGEGDGWIVEEEEEEADVSKMYRAIQLVEEDKDLHLFVWRSSPQDTIKDYRMTRVTFRVAA